MSSSNDLHSLNNYIRIYDNILPKDVLKNFQKICDNQEKFTDAEIYQKNKSAGVDQFHRKTLVWPLHNGTHEKSLTNIHWSGLWVFQFNNYIERYKQDTQINPGQTILHDIQVLKYVNDGHYKFHCDSGYAIHRTISCIFLINEEYEGGELMFALPNYTKEFAVEKKANRMIVWPSNFLYPHKVKPVKKGIRYSVVAWAQ